MGASQPLRVNADLVLPGDDLMLSYSRSGGPGGQNVNKVETCVLLRFPIGSSRALRADQKERLRTVLRSRITTADEILVRADRNRQRSRNEEEARARLAEILAKALLPKKSRRASRPSRGSVERRLESKRRKSSVKRDRRGEDG